MTRSIAAILAVAISAFAIHPATAGCWSCGGMGDKVEHANAERTREYDSSSDERRGAAIAEGRVVVGQGSKTPSSDSQNGGSTGYSGDRNPGGGPR